MVLGGAVFPRLMLLGGPPSTDEGFYAFQAQSIHHELSMGRRLSDTGTLAVYPALLAWAFGLSYNPVVLLRLADLGVAAIGALLLYRVLARESGSKGAAILIGLVFVLTMNQPIFVQYGFKNSIAAAFVPLLLALLLTQQSNPRSGWPWIAAGALTALAVLLRETFVPFAVFGFVAVWIGRGARPALRFALGGAAGGALMLGGLVLMRGGLGGAVEAYRDAGAVYATVSAQRVQQFLDSGLAAADVAAAALFLSATALAVILAGAGRFRDRRILARLAFWLACAALPLIEPASKIGFPYHFGACLPGLAGMCALAWKVASNMGPGAGMLLRAVGGLMAVLILASSRMLLQSWPATSAVLDPQARGFWPASYTASSNYLLAADAIRNISPRNGTLSVSGFMFALYPLTGRLPPSPGLANLSAAFIKLDLSVPRMRDALLACPPDVIMTTTRTDWPGGPGLVEAVEATGLYRKTAEIAVSADRSYGNFGGAIYSRTEPIPETARPRSCEPGSAAR